MMSSRQTQTAAEINEIPAAIRHQMEIGIETYWTVGNKLRDTDIQGFITCARGSSDHAATFFKYLIEAHTGLPVASIGPSVATLYKANLKLDGFAAIAFSQSGSSPDILALLDAASRGGARTFSVLNVTDSPLGNNAETILPIHVGPEMAVAATKSFVGMLIVSLGILAGYLKDRSIISTLQHLPDLAQQVLNSDKVSTIDKISKASSLYCIGRGLGYAMACEIALKFKELCHLHAEAYSAAEVLHGPATIAHEKFVTLFVESSGIESASMEVARQNMKSRGAKVMTLASTPKLTNPSSSHCRIELISPIIQIISFYVIVEKLARAFGFNPDLPAGLQKVTKTI